MQMLRDEGIDIDERMARARVLCRNRVLSEVGGASEDLIEEKVEECALVEEGVIYARAINEMNANRADAFDTAMAQYNAEVAEVARQKREYDLDMQRHKVELAEIKRKQEQFEREQQQYEAEMAAHEEILKGRGLPVPARRAQTIVTAQTPPPERQTLPVQAAPSATISTLAQGTAPASQTQAPGFAGQTQPVASSSPDPFPQAQGAALAVNTAPEPILEAVPSAPRYQPAATQPRTQPANTPVPATALAQNTVPSGASSQATQTPTVQRPSAGSATALTRGVASGRGYGKRLSGDTRPGMQEDIELAVAMASGPRIALVMGNEEYSSAMGSLANPVNDAVMIGQTLRILGFDVEIVRDANQREMKEAVQRLGTRLQAAGNNATGLFYYAGHGVQSKGQNYLIPVESDIDAESDLELEAVPADAILAQMEEAYVSTRIVILDACRNMPLRRRSRSGERGLARMETPNGSFVAYSTSPGSIAADGGGTNSPFAESLAEQMLVPDRAIEETFREVRRQVVENTSGDQVPWNSSSLLDKFSFAISQ